MSAIDISLLTRVVQSYFMFDPDSASQALPILEAAHQDGNAASLSDAETQALLNSALEQTHQVREQMSLLTRNRDHLVGSLRDAQRRMREAGATDGVVEMLERAAGEDEHADQLSEIEVQQFMASVDHELSGLTEPDLNSIRSQVRAVLDSLRNLQAEMPLAFVPEGREAQEASVDLNFLKNLPESVFFGEDEQAQMLQQLIMLGHILQTNETTGEPVWQSHEENWDLSWEDMTAAYDHIPEDRRERIAPPEVMMANMRFLAHVFEEGLNQRMGEITSTGGEAGGDSIGLQILLDHPSEIASDPFVQLLIENAGDDGVLTRIELERLARLRHEIDGIDVDVDAVIFTARRIVAEYSAQFRESETAVAPEVTYTRDQYTSIRMLDALNGMREGFTRTDTEHVEDSSAAWITNAASWVVTLGGLLTSWVDSDQWQSGDFCLGPTARHLMRQSVVDHDRERGEALEALRSLITNPPEEFLHYLEAHADRLREQNGSNEPSMANALHYLSHQEDRSHPERNRHYYEILTGPTFQADRIWRIYRLQEQGEREEAEALWFQLAQDLRDGYWSSHTYLDHLNNPHFARAILGYLIDTSGDDERHPEWREALDDSTGAVILDPESTDGDALMESRGDSLLLPTNWFDWGGFTDGRFALNWSDEQEAEIIGDLALTAISYRMAGWGFRAMGGIGSWLMESLGLRFATGAVEASGGTLIQRMFGGTAARMVANAQARVAAATTVAEQRLAARALERAVEFAGMVNSEAPVGAAAEAVAPRLTGWLGRVVQAHPPIPAAWEATSLAGRSGARVLLARGAAALLRNISLAGAGRGLKYVSFDGIVLLAMARLSYDNLHESDLRLSYNREIELGLPEPVEAPATVDSPGPTRLGSDGRGADAGEPTSPALEILGGSGVDGGEDGESRRR